MISAVQVAIAIAIAKTSVLRASPTPHRMGEEGIVLTLSDFHLSPMIFETNTTLEIGLCFNLNFNQYKCKISFVS